MPDERDIRLEAAERLVAVLSEQLRAAEQRDQALQAQIRHLTALVEGMQKQLAEALRAGAATARKTKKGAPESGDSTRTEASSPPKSEPPLERREPTLPTQKPRRPADLPAHLPRDVHPIPVPSCAHCGAVELTQVGGEVSERIHYVRAHVRVQRDERPTCRCRTCGGFTTAPMPPSPVPGGSMSASTLAHIAYSKCCLHLPLARIAEDLHRLGVDVASSTLCDAMGHIALLLEPIRDQIMDELFASGLVHLDGTGIKVLVPGEKGSYTGQFTVLSNAQAATYHFTSTKEGEHLADLLRIGTDRAFRGYLVADAASNMNLLYADGSIIECGCWYHARDKFVDASGSAPVEATEGIAWITALFEVEHEADAAGDDPEQRLARRQRDAKPILDGFERWMTAAQTRFTPDEELYKAIQYYRNQRTALTRFLTDGGRIPLTNNQAERDLGPIGRGRKAYLFAGSDAGGDRLASIYTAIETCRRLDADPFAYLADVLPHLSTMPVNRGKRAEDLTPKAWTARQTSCGP
mgnify:CR=1 FL=1